MANRRLSRSPKEMLNRRRWVLPRTRRLPRTRVRCKSRAGSAPDAPGLSQPPAELVHPRQASSLGPYELGSSLDGDTSFGPHGVDDEGRPRIIGQIPQLYPVDIEFEGAGVTERIHDRHHVRPTGRPHSRETADALRAQELELQLGENHHPHPI